MKLITSGTCAFVCLVSAPAIACLGTSGGRTYRPFCQIPAAQSGDELIKLEVYGGELDRGLIEVEVSPGTKPIYLVLTSMQAVTWRFHGATERLSRVIALGAERDGAGATGVAGLKPEQVSFPSASLDLRATSMCDTELKACHADDYLYRLAAPDTGMAVLNVRSTDNNANSLPFATIEGVLAPDALEKPRSTITITDKDSNAILIPEMQRVKREPYRDGVDQAEVLRPPSASAPIRLTP